MKKRIFLLACLFMGLCFIVSNQTVSAAENHHKLVSRSLYVQQGKTYRLSKILSELYDPDEGDTLKNCLKGKKTYQAKKSQIKLTKNTLKVKKQGDYKLTVKTKKKKYTITLSSRAEKWPAIPEGITKVTLMREGKFVEVQDAATIQYLCSLFKSADYRFSYKESNLTKAGWSYSICLYTSDGKMERRFTISDTFLTMGTTDFTLDGNYVRKNGAVNPKQYVAELYASLLGQQ